MHSGASKFGVAAVAVFAMLGLKSTQKERLSFAHTATPDGLDPEQSPNSVTFRTVAILGLWAAFVAYAYLAAPGGSPEAQSRDLEVLTEVFATPGKANAIFLAIFNCLGIMPACYAAVLLPGARGQRLPALPFVVGSFALGFFSLGPYLALREIRRQATPPQGWFAKSLESKVTAGLLLASGVGLVSYGAGLWGGADFAVQSAQYLELFQAQRLVHVSSLDLCVLSALFPFTVTEDMQRRGWQVDVLRVLLFSVPVLGPAAYLLLRPPLRD
eukprot:EG_transcript_16857